jgi:hypothetical protein
MNSNGVLTLAAATTGTYSITYLRLRGRTNPSNCVTAIRNSCGNNPLIAVMTPAAVTMRRQYAKCCSQ